MVPNTVPRGSFFSQPLITLMLLTHHYRYVLGEGGMEGGREGREGMGIKGKEGGRWNGEGGELRREGREGNGD